MADVVFWGATGQARVLRECVGHAGHRLVALFDNDLEVRSPFADVPLYHGWAGFQRWRAAHQRTGMHYLAAIGGSAGGARMEIGTRLEAEGLSPLSAIHPTAFVAESATLGPGAQILAQAAVCVDVELGPHCIINTAASVDHECRLGAGVHVCPGAHLAGCVEVGPRVTIGTGASVIPRVKIGVGAVVGAGAVVVDDVAPETVVAGVPARIINQGAKP